ncbi:shikimate kinase, partial [Caldisalinibacter kiritimatiensis]|uniref:shikimate kinase n=1 Tax=Caldisalinibacter kiritimatiensis TaxID=1304284 RepID=UPI000550E092
MKSNIVLIGFMGTGKTTIGKFISERTEMDFLDTDKLIEELNKMKIPEIFDKYGESFFRNEERKVVNKIYLKNNSVISTGGG